MLHSIITVFAAIHWHFYGVQESQFPIHKTCFFKKEDCSKDLVRGVLLNRILIEASVEYNNNIV